MILCSILIRYKFKENSLFITSRFLTVKSGETENVNRPTDVIEKDITKDVAMRDSDNSYNDNDIDKNHNNGNDGTSSPDTKGEENISEIRLKSKNGSNDDFISDDVYSLLSIQSDSVDVESTSKELFKRYYEDKSLTVVPDVSLSHIKDKENAARLVILSNDASVKYKTWEYFRSVCLHVTKRLSDQLKPVEGDRLIRLNNLFIQSERMRELPVWTLGPIRGSLANTAYGLSHGAQDLLYFVQTKHDSLSFRYNYSSKIESGSKNSSSIDIVLSNGTNPVRKFSTKFNNHLADITSMEIKSRIGVTQSMFRNEHYKNVMSDLMSVESSSRASFSQSSISTRVIFSVRKDGGQTFDEGFNTSLTMNNDVILSVDDKNIVDMLASFLLVDDISMSDTSMELASRYAATLLHRYVLSQLFIEDGIKILDMEMSVDLVRKCNDRSELMEKLSKYVSDGHMVPITPLHYKAVLDSSLDDKWKKYIFWSSFANVGFNKGLDVFLPQIQSSSSSYISHVSKNKDMLDTTYYLPDSTFEWQEMLESKVSYNNFLWELLTRIVFNDEEISCIPMISRGDWMHGSISMSVFSVPEIHRLAKFSVSDSYALTIELIEILALTSKIKDLRRPGYVRSRTRAVKSMPPIMSDVIDE